MILQKLCEYYDRVAEEKPDEIAPFGFVSAKIHHKAVISRNGRLIQISDVTIPVQRGKKIVNIPSNMIVPSSFTRASNILPFFTWDNAIYIFGLNYRNNADRALQCFEAFKTLHQQLLNPIANINPYAQALLSFLNRWDPSDFRNYIDDETFNAIAKSNIVFQLDGENLYIHDNPEIKSVWLEYFENIGNKEVSNCLVTGETDELADLHNSIKGVKNCGAVSPLISFNDKNFESWGDKKYNAPIGRRAAIKYATALNYLIADKQHCTQTSDSTIVYWTDKPSPLESIIGTMINKYIEDEVELSNIQNLMRTIYRGEKIYGISYEDLNDTSYHILGLSGNSGRIVPKFWYVNSVGNLLDNLRQHLLDMKAPSNDDKYSKFIPSIYRLLLETGRKEGEKVNKKTIATELQDELIYAIINNTAYPYSLMYKVLTRVKAEHHISEGKAAILYGCLIRNDRRQKTGKDIPNMLNKETNNTGYQLGRLFAVLEKLQLSTDSNLGASITDRYFGSAMSTPQKVFPSLINLSQHHMDKSKYNIYYDKKIAEILSHITKFPPTLVVDDQAMFCLGYYHQKLELYTKKSDESKLELGKGEE